MTKQFLKDNDVAYEYVDVDLCDEEDKQKIRADIQKRGGALSYPTTIIDDKENHHRIPKRPAYGETWALTANVETARRRAEADAKNQRQYTLSPTLTFCRPSWKD